MVGIEIRERIDRLHIRWIVYLVDLLGIVRLVGRLLVLCMDLRQSIRLRDGIVVGLLD